MSIESGTFNCKAFKLIAELPPDTLDKFANIQLPPENMILSENAVTGYVSGFNYDTDINGYNSTIDDYIYLSFRTAKRTMPASLVDTLLVKAMEKYKTESGTSIIPKKMQKEMKQNIIDSNIAKMPISYSDMPFVINRASNCVYVFNTSEAKLDNLKAEFIKIFGIALDDIPSFETIKKIPNLTLSNRDSRNEFNYADYLTWLMYKNDTSSNSYKIGDNYIVLAEGDIELTDYIDTEEERGNIRTILKSGITSRSSELKSALLSGKKISALSLNIAPEFGGEVTEVKFIANSCDFHLSGIKLADGEEMEKDSIFIERMDMLKDLFQLFAFSIANYTTELENKAKLKNDIVEWIKELPIQIMCGETKPYIEIDKMETPDIIKDK